MFVSTLQRDVWRCVLWQYRHCAVVKKPAEVALNATKEKGQEDQIPIFEPTNVCINVETRCVALCVVAIEALCRCRLPAEIVLDRTEGKGQERPDKHS